PETTLVFWASSSLIFILMVTVGWILFREGIKLYIARQGNHAGSRIRTKLVVGALLLSCLPISVFVLWSYEVLNYNLNAWFTNPAENQNKLYVAIADSLGRELQNRLDVQASLLALQPEVRQLVLDGAAPPAGFLERFSREQEVDSAAILNS